MNDAKPSKGGVVFSTASSASGFTIVETLIVLAVTGFLLLISLLTFAGQQSKVEFTQSIRDVQSRIQQTINEVGSGFSGDSFLDPETTKCVVSGGKPEVTYTGGQGRGTNDECIFMGRLMQFGEGGDTGLYRTMSLVGIKDNGGKIANARPVVTESESQAAATFPGGLKVVKMTYTIDGTAHDTTAVGLVSGLGTLDSSYQLISGSQQLSIIPIPNSGTTTNPGYTTIKDTVSAQILAAPIEPNGGVQICFQSGGTKQSGLITIGGSGRGAIVKLDIKSSVDCT